MKTELLTTGNPKTQKGEKLGYYTAILHLAPWKLSGKNVCSHASEQCRELCLNTAGRGRFDRTQQARIRRTSLLLNDPENFGKQILREISKLQRYAEKQGLTLVIRLNGTSDLPWERMKFSGKTLMEHFPSIQFYDYTKIPGRVNLPSNYHLTFSLSENNTADALSELDRGRNVAVVFHNVPPVYAGRMVINGDESDLRFLDPVGVVVGLKAKGKAKNFQGGFVK